MGTIGALAVLFLAAYGLTRVLEDIQRKLITHEGRSCRAWKQR